MTRISLEEFKNHLNNLTESGEFSFGFNWLDYVKTRLNENVISQHVSNLSSLYSSINVGIEGKTVLDIGCGSGLSSLSFSRLGAQKVTSFDIDPYSVQATELTKSKFFHGKTDWSVHKASILDKPNIQQHDIVYSWGVLHHTGAMEDAIKNASTYVKDGGYFHVALYRSGPTYQAHLAEKQKYASLPKEQKIEMLYHYMIRCHGSDLLSQNIDSRGMNIFHDALDWLGGLPYEVSNPQHLSELLQGFEKIYMKDWAEGGNFVMIFRKV